MMNFIINGKKFELKDDVSVLEFLLNQGFDCEKIALEADGEILSKKKWKETFISKFKKYEIVEFVGGG